MVSSHDYIVARMPFQRPSIFTTPIAEFILNQDKNLLNLLGTPSEAGIATVVSIVENNAKHMQFLL